MKIEKKTPLHKALSGNVKILPGDERTVTAVITNTAVDRDGDVIIAQGMNLKDFEANPVVMYGHDYDLPPVAKVVGIERGEELIMAKIQFAERPKDFPDDDEWLPATLFSLYQQGIMNAFSIGFIPTDYRAANSGDARRYGDECKQVINRSKLLEISCVGLPANQEAVAVAVSKGLMSQKMADKLLHKDAPAVMPEPMNGGGQAVHDEMGTCAKCEKQFPMGDLTQTTDEGGEGPYLMCLSCRDETKKAADVGEDVVGVAAMVKGLKKRGPNEDVEPLARTYTQYSRHGNTYEPAPDIKLEGTLGKYAYRVIDSWGGPVFQRMKAQTDELYKFDNSIMSEVLGEIDRFWDLKGDYDSLGLMHTRGMLLYGPPGMGKTSVINQVSDMIVSRGDVVLYAKNIGVLTEGLNAFREVEPERKAVVVLEDADEYVGYQERDFLQLLDGEKSVDGVLYLATTNYLDRFPPRLLRPGRFDKQVFVGAPPYEGRLAYLTNKLKNVEQSAEIERLARETDGMSFGHLRELITAVYALKEPAAEVLRRLQASVKPPKEYQKQLATVKAKAVAIGGVSEPHRRGSHKEQEAGEPKDITRTIVPAKRVAAVVNLREPDAAHMKVVSRRITPLPADVAERTRKAVVRVVSKRRGRIWLEE